MFPVGRRKWANIVAKKRLKTVQRLQKYAKFGVKSMLRLNKVNQIGIKLSFKNSLLNVRNFTGSKHVIDKAIDKKAKVGGDETVSCKGVNKALDQNGSMVIMKR